ncbi:MAG: hypothetical protein KG003_10835 [Bacteroidetes bacterium]|nr:hypothetical protein [Bacteroidota bacterium]
MTKITEELQMKIFDLLEGNLSDKEKAEVLNMISASAELQKEYQLLSKTYFIPEDDHVVFPNKNKLYRKPGLFFSWNPIVRYAAASVVIAACAYSGWYFMRGNNGAQNENIGKQIPQTNKIELSPKNNSSQQKLELNSNENSENFVATKKRIAPSDKTELNTQKTIQPDQKQMTIPVVKLDEEVKNTDAEIIADAIENGNVPDSTATATNTQQGPVRISKKRSLSYKLLHNSREMLANLQLPNIKFKAEKNNNRNIPTIKMEIKTYKTDVIATLIE